MLCHRVGHARIKLKKVPFREWKKPDRRLCVYIYVLEHLEVSQVNTTLLLITHIIYAADCQGMVQVEAYVPDKAIHIMMLSWRRSTQQQYHAHRNGIWIS